jgi:hypothetical protein
VERPPRPVAGGVGWVAPPTVTRATARRDRHFAGRIPDRPAAGAALQPELVDLAARGLAVCYSRQPAGTPGHDRPADQGRAITGPRLPAARAARYGPP